MSNFEQPIWESDGDPAAAGATDPGDGPRGVAELPSRIAAATPDTERAGIDATRIGTGVSLVLAAQAAAGVGLGAAFAYLSGLRASRVLAAAARGLGER